MLETVTARATICHQKSNRKYSHNFIWRLFSILSLICMHELLKRKLKNVFPLRGHFFTSQRFLSFIFLFCLLSFCVSAAGKLCGFRCSSILCNKWACYSSSRWRCQSCYNFVFQCCWASIIIFPFHVYVAHSATAAKGENNEFGGKNGKWKKNYLYVAFVLHNASICFTLYSFYFPTMKLKFVLSLENTP